MKIEVELNDQQIEFLKEFNKKQYSGAKDNLCTCDAMHIVQKKIYDYVPEEYDNEKSQYQTEGLVFIDNDDNEYDKVEDAVIGVLKDNDEYDEKSFKSMKNTKNCYFCDDYIESYGLENEIKIFYKNYEYENVAYFWILDEAKRYIKYQSHNLGSEARTYTVSGGYQNFGSYVEFRNLLMSIGKKINDEDKNEEDI